MGILASCFFAITILVNNSRCRVPDDQQKKDYMKRLRWLTFLPLALLGGLAANLVLTICVSMPFVVERQVLYRVALGVSGVAFSGVLFTIGFQVVPTVNRRSKWLLGGMALLVGLALVAVAVPSKDTEAMATNVGMLLSALPVLVSSPEQLRKWFRIKLSPLPS
jgi:hypothetical protein